MLSQSRNPNDVSCYNFELTFYTYDLYLHNFYQELITLLGSGLTMDREGVMVGANNAKFGEKGRCWKLAVGNNKGKEVEGGGGGVAKGGGVSPWKSISN